MHIYEMCLYIYTCLINNCCLIFKQEKKYFEKKFIIYKYINIKIKKIIKKMMCCLEEKKMYDVVLYVEYIYIRYI